MFPRPKILFLVSLLFVALLNPKFNPYLLFKFLIFYHSIYIYMYNNNFLDVINDLSMLMLNAINAQYAQNYADIIGASLTR